jgi:hypothetical protein
LGERLAVFNPPFVEEDGHGIMYCNGIDIFKGIFNGGHGYFKSVSSIFIDGMWVVALAPAVMTISVAIFHPLEAILSISVLYLWFFASIDSCTYLNLDPQILSKLESWGEEVPKVSPNFQNRLQCMYLRTIHVFICSNALASTYNQ